MATEQTPTPDTGLGLKLARVAARVRQRPIAEAMGVSVSRVAAIEREAVVTITTAERFMDALARVAQSRQAA